MAVVLGHGVGAAAVHAAGDPAVRILELREPFDVGAHGLRVPEPQESGGDQGAVADPGAGVGARPRPDRGTVALEERVGEVAAERPQERPRGGGSRESDAVELPAPIPRAGGEAPREELPRFRPREGPARGVERRLRVERQLERDFVGSSGRRIQVEGEGARGVASTRPALAREGGSSPRARKSVIGPASKETAPNPEAGTRAKSRGNPFTLTAEPSHSRLAIFVAPPAPFKNCVGGLTWKGRSARKSFPFCLRAPELPTR